LDKCLKEWNAVVESLGQGKQTILIRKYKTNLKEFLLYPTYSYSLKDNFLNSFQKKYRSFVEKNTLPNQDEEKIEIKYYARVENIIQKSPNRIEGLQKNSIWTKDHIQSYLGGKICNIWVLRVYRLKNPNMVFKIRGPILYANLKEDVSLSGIKPVIGDDKFSEIISELK
jgi:hypothetical protein